MWEQFINMVTNPEFQASTVGQFILSLPLDIIFNLVIFGGLGVLLHRYVMDPYLDKRDARIEAEKHAVLEKKFGNYIVNFVNAEGRIVRVQGFGMVKLQSMLEDPQGQFRQELQSACTAINFRSSLALELTEFDGSPSTAILVGLLSFDNNKTFTINMSKNMSVDEAIKYLHDNNLRSDDWLEKALEARKLKMTQSAKAETTKISTQPSPFWRTVGELMESFTLYNGSYEIF